jgi:hypothetical protein
MNEIGGLELQLGDDPVQVGYVGYGPLGYGIYYPMAAAPWPPITVEPGDTVRVHVRFQHRGKECSATVYVSMGVRTLTIFDEDPQLTKSRSVSLPREDTWTEHSESIDIPIPSTYTRFGYAKIMLDGEDKAISPEYDDCVRIAEVVPEFQMVEITKYESV